MKDVTLNQREQARLQVLNSVLEYQIPQAQAAEVLGIGERQVRRILAAYRREGAVQTQALEGGKLSGDEAYRAIARAEQQVAAWRQYSLDGSGLPHAPEDAAVLHTLAGELAAALSELSQVVSRPEFLKGSIRDLRLLLESMASQEPVAVRLSEMRQLEWRFAVAGIIDIIRDVGAGTPVEMATQAIACAWLQGVWSELVLSEPRLAGFVGEAHNRSRDDFARLDLQHLQHNPARIRREAAEQAIAAMNEYPEQRDLVRREAVKRSRHLSVRQLVHQAPEVLCGLRPCWMMSPLQVAEMIPADTELFDVVIFDEASQIPPAEAIGTLARAKQAVVAGDDRQLPPTSFFRSQEPEDYDDESDDADDGLALIANIESILDVVKGLPIKEQMLQWHYRSRDGRLIAFSNNHIYGEALTAFPGTALESPLTFHQLDLPPTSGRSTRSHLTRSRRWLT